jgi:hypothetical protein
VNTANTPVVEIRVDSIPAGTGVNTPSLPEAGPATSFDFDVQYTFPPTHVQIKNTCPFSCPTRQPFIRLDDYIENPIGKTEISNASGDILSGAGSEIIRTNILDLDAPNGHIGHQSPTHAEPDLVRNPIMVELIRFKHPDPEFCGGAATPCLFDFMLTADAGKDVVLDLTANRRTDEALGSALTVTIAHINAGDDVDVVVNDSKNGNDAGTRVLVTVNMYNPATPFYGYVYYDSYDPALGLDSGPLNPCTGGCGDGSGQYETHFRPDGTSTSLAHILRALGTVGSEIDSTYDFEAVQAGDDIDICHVSTGGEEPKSCKLTETVLKQR